MSDWRRLLAETETHQTHPFNPLNPILTSQADNLKDKKDHLTANRSALSVPEGLKPSVVPSPPKFTHGQRVLITDNENHVRAGVIQFADWLDEPMTAQGWWYCVLDVYGLLSETHESRLTDTGLVKTERVT